MGRAQAESAGRGIGMDAAAHGQLRPGPRRGRDGHKRGHVRQLSAPDRADIRGSAPRGSRPRGPPCPNPSPIRRRGRAPRRSRARDTLPPPPRPRRRSGWAECRRTRSPRCRRGAHRGPVSPRRTRPGRRRSAATDAGRRARQARRRWSERRRNRTARAGKRGVPAWRQLRPWSRSRLPRSRCPPRGSPWRPGSTSGARSSPCPSPRRRRRCGHRSSARSSETAP